MTTRLWFRLDEVLPLAAHATTCPSQRLTQSQVRAGARLRPGLVWTTTDEYDTLTSNGVPVWYDQDGRDHSAVAWTWRHPATGQRGTPDQPDARRFLPLTGRGHALLTLLRRGAAKGGRWLVIDTDPACPRRLQILDHREEIAPPQAIWVPANVTAPAVGRGVYPALVADGYTVAGHDVLARFHRTTVEQMIADLDAIHTDANPGTDPMPGEFAVLRLATAQGTNHDEDVVVVSWQRDDGVDEHLVEIDRVNPDPDGYYPIGAYLWPWYPQQDSPNAAAPVRTSRVDHRGFTPVAGGLGDADEGDRFSSRSAGA
jgi:hypothetical protein